jgi:hypothetical protein
MERWLRLIVLCINDHPRDKRRTRLSHRSSDGRSVLEEVDSESRAADFSIALVENTDARSSYSMTNPQKPLNGEPRDAFPFANCPSPAARCARGAHPRCDAMKFLCLGYFDREKRDALSETELAAAMGECATHLNELHASGRVIVDVGLRQECRSLRRVADKLAVTDGPFAEAKEVIGSAVLIEARDMDEAIRVASLHPTTRVSAGERLGWRLEVRPVHYFGGNVAKGQDSISA